jgi:hypothetical protein
MDPTSLAQILMALGQQNPLAPGQGSPELAALMEQLSPEDITRMVQGTFQSPGGPNNLGDALTTGVAADAGMGAQQSLYPPLNPPPGQPLLRPSGPPGPPDPTQQPQQRFPQVRMPEATRPIFSGGVAGSQKAPDMSTNAGLSPAMALMQAILGPRARGGGGRPQGGGQGLGALGAILSGQS